MHTFSVTTLLAVLSTCHFVRGTDNTVSPIPGYTMETLQWIIEVFPGQNEILNGTIQEVYAQALQINPSFELPESENNDLAETTESIQKSVVECGIYRTAEKRRIQEGVRYLNSLRGTGRPWLGPGPGRCSRVSCSYNAAIIWCNDSRDYKELGGWEWLADSAQHVVNVCAPAADQVSGRNLELGDWTTNILWERC